MKNKIAGYGPSVLRVFLGLLFIIPGIMKLMGPKGIIGMLGKLGFPAAAFFGWVLILTEIFIGLAVLIGFRVRYTVWPLVVILFVAMVTVAIPNMSQPMGVIGVLWHLLGIAALVSVFLTGAGKFAVTSD